MTAVFMVSIFLEAVHHETPPVLSAYLWAILVVGLGFLLPFQAVRLYWHHRYRRNEERLL